MRAQYRAGTAGGRTLPAYRDAPDVAPNSTVETYVALKLMIDNWRWAGVPFYLRTGKALARRRSEVVIEFKKAPFALFRDTPVERLTPNDMILKIQPEEGVVLRFNAKVPGPSVREGAVAMRFEYKDYFKAEPSTGYETLLYDALIGDPMLFQRADTIEGGWRAVQPVLDAWARSKPTASPSTMRAARARAKPMRSSRATGGAGDRSRRNDMALLLALAPDNAAAIAALRAGPRP